MKHKHNFGRFMREQMVAPTPESRVKRRITIRLDQDLLDHFLKEAGASRGKAGYQTLINQALRRHVEGNASKLDETQRRIVRVEVRSARQHWPRKFNSADRSVD